MCAELRPTAGCVDAEDLMMRLDINGVTIVLPLPGPLTQPTLYTAAPTATAILPIAVDYITSRIIGMWLLSAQPQYRSYSSCSPRVARSHPFWPRSLSIPSAIRYFSVSSSFILPPLLLSSAPLQWRCHPLSPLSLSIASAIPYFSASSSFILPPL